MDQETRQRQGRIARAKAGGGRINYRLLFTRSTDGCWSIDDDQREAVKRLRYPYLYDDTLIVRGPNVYLYEGNIRELLPGESVCLDGRTAAIIIRTRLSFRLHKSRPFPRRHAEIPPMRDW